MIVSPDGEGRLDVRRVVCYEVRREDLVNQISATRGRGEKGRWCQLSSTADTDSPNLHWKRSLEPGHITIQANVDNVRKSATKQVIKRL